MNKIQNKLQKFQVKLLVFTLLFLLITACFVRQSKDESKVENKPEKSETTGKKDTGSIEKLKEQSKPKEVEKSAVSSSSDDWKKKVCKKYDECGCQDYEECLEEAADLYYEDEVWACMLKSSCESLCAGKPDVCINGENNPGTTAPNVPQVPNCYATTCTRDSDCPGGCSGGCSEGHCYLF